jgi:predicted AAA+ superfamily ATPase
MNKDRLKEVMLDQKEAFNCTKHLIRRNIPLEKYIKTSQVVIISGIRRCGKYLLPGLTQNYLAQKYPPA